MVNIFTFAYSVILSVYIYSFPGNVQAKMLEEMDEEFGISGLVEEEFKPDKAKVLWNKWWNIDISGLVKKWHSFNFVYYGISKLLLLSRPILVTSLYAQLFVVLCAIKKSFLANKWSYEVLTWQWGYMCVVFSPE